MCLYPLCRLHPWPNPIQHVPHPHPPLSLHGKLTLPHPLTSEPILTSQGIMMMLWAIVSALTAVAKDFKGLLLTRFFLGLTEAPYYPGAVYLLSIFYTRKEVATRIAILYTGNILATAFAGLIAAGIFHGLDDVAGIAGWKWLFILQGAVTFVIAVIGYFVLPDFPLTTRWLTEEERQLAHNRMELDTVGNKGETSTWKGLKQAASDPMVWIFCAMAHLHLAANGFKNFVSFSIPQLVLNANRLVPLCRQDSRLQHHHHPRPHLPSLPHRRRQHHPCLMDVGQIQRANLAHHRLQDRRSHRFRLSRCYSQHSWSLRLHGHLHNRNIRRQQSYPRLVRLCLRSDQGEEGCCHQHGYYDYEHQLYLDSLSLA